MQQFPPVNEVRPYGVVDLTDQSTMLLVLEELGIAHLQDEWLRTHTPEAPMPHRPLSSIRSSLRISAPFSKERPVPIGWSPTAGQA